MLIDNESQWNYFGRPNPFLPTVPWKTVAAWRRGGVADVVVSACVVGGLRASGPPPRDWRYGRTNKTINQELHKLKWLAAAAPDKIAL
jgi:hypothetical protein